MKNLKYWLLACRPKTLSLAASPVLAGTALAAADQGVIHAGILTATLMAAMLIQIGTNLHNDAADFERGADDVSTRLGPPRATASGWFTGAQVKSAAWLAFSCAFLLGVYLAYRGGWPIVALGLAALASGWAYTGGPKPLAYTALGELFVFLFFGLAAVVGTYYLQTGTADAAAWGVGALLGMPAAAVLAVNNYRDRDNDAKVGKNTLAVRLSRRGGQIEYALLMLVPFAGLLALAWRWPVVLVVLVLLPLSAALVRRFLREAPGPAFNVILAATARFQLLFSLVLSTALVLWAVLAR